MQIVTSYFARDSRYETLLRVFQRSAAKMMSGVKVEVLHLEPIKQDDDPKKAHRFDCTVAFLEKAEYAMRAKEPTLVCDCDLLFLRSVEDVEDYDADIVYTTRKWRHPFNSGLFLVRPTRRARTFIQCWIDRTLYLSKEYNQSSVQREIRLDAGIDQAALRYAVKETDHHTRIKTLPCQRWNATQSEYGEVDERTRVVHVKSKLRDDLLAGRKPDYYNAAMDRAVELWRRYARVEVPNVSR